MAGFLKFLAAIVPWLVKLIQHGERVKLERENEQLADAARKDLDAIGNDGRSVPDALAKLRARGVRTRTAKRDGRLPPVS